MKLKKKVAVITGILLVVCVVVTSSSFVQIISSSNQTSIKDQSDNTNVNESKLPTENKIIEGWDIDPEFADKDLSPQIDKSIPNKWKNPDTNEYLPANPLDDPECAYEWRSEFDALKYMTLPPDQIECDKDIYFTVYDDTLTNSSLELFINKYLKRVCALATEKNINTQDKKYTYTLEAINNPKDYPSGYTYIMGVKLLKLRFEIK